jgi:2-methylcitrate dehydratase PrpD
MKPLEAVSNFIANSRYREIPDPVLAEARKAIIDCIGVSLAATREPCLSILRSFIEKMGGEPRSLLWGTHTRTSPVWAALYNGTMAHALDFDDGAGLPIPLHPSVPILPAVIALGEYLGAGGAQVLEAYILGTEVECKLARGCSRQSYDDGWHATGVFGTMGAAAAACKLLSLDEARIGNALGIALSHTGGSRQNFGTMVKPLHAGTAAKNGILSGLLAEEGYTGSKGALDGPLGFGRLFGGQTLEEELNALGKPFHLFNGFSIKKYPSCYATHSTIDTVLNIARENPIDYREVKRIDCWVHFSHPAGLPYRIAASPLEGKFSIPFVVAVACVFGNVEMSHFVDNILSDRRVVELSEKVNMLAKDDMPVLGSEVRITTTAGETYKGVTDRPRGHALNPLSLEEVENKFRSCAGLLLPKGAVEEVLHMLHHLEEMENIKSLTEAISN